VSFILLRRQMRVEGLGLRAVYYGWRRPIWRELLIALGVLVFAGPLAQVPQSLLGQWLFGEPMIAVQVMMRPLPLWALYPLMLLFPLTIALVELPLYFGYVMPRLHALTGQGGLALALAVLALAAQHITLPLVPDTRFIFFRFLVFVPLALLLGTALRLRPSLMPYLMIGHGLADFMAVMTILMVMRGWV
jgi:hypothetical protein